MATAQQAAFLLTARRVAAAQVNAIGPNGELLTTQLSYADRVTYDKTLAGIILAHPDVFAPSAVQAAQGVAAANIPGSLQTYSVTQAVSDFVDEAANQGLAIGESVASIGSGIKSTLNLAAWLIPAAALAAVVILGVALAKKSGATK